MQPCSTAPLRACVQRPLAMAAAGWAAALAHWLGWAYALEFKGGGVHACLWGAGLLFLGAHVAVLRELVAALGGQA
jgi:hypothetical protein